MCACTINHLYYAAGNHYLEITKDKSRPKVPKVTETTAKQRLGAITQLCRAVISSRDQQTLRLHDALLWHSLQYYAQFQSPSFKNRGSEENSNFFLNLLKLRSRSSHFLFTSLEVTTRKRNISGERLLWERVKTKNCKVLHQYRGNRSSGWVLQSSENTGIKVFRGIISVVIERRAQGRFSSSSDCQYTETRSKNTSTLRQK